MTQLKKGDRVRSIKNNTMTYRILAIGEKRAKLIAEGIGYYTAYCPTLLLVKVRG